MAEDDDDDNDEDVYGGMGFAENAPLFEADLGDDNKSFLRHESLVMQRNFAGDEEPIDGQPNSKEACFDHYNIMVAYDIFASLSPSRAQLLVRCF